MHRRRFLTLTAAGLTAQTRLSAQETDMDLDPNWSYVADGVMGGVSQGRATLETVEGRRAARLTGDVSLDNNGGFIQIAFDLREDGAALDASAWTGVAFEALGNGESYDIRLRTNQLRRPWQSFRTAFTASSSWQTQRIPFTDFEAHRIDATFDPTRLRRIGILAIGRAFQADVAIAGMRLYR